MKWLNKDLDLPPDKDKDKEDLVETEEEMEVPTLNTLENTQKPLKNKLNKKEC